MSKRNLKTQPKLNIGASKRKKYELPPPIKCGEIFVDIVKKKWKIGKSVGVGGFGEIYSASSIIDGKASEENFVIKVEPHSNGPLFTEINFYMRVAKINDIEEWTNRNKLKSLGMPKYISSGSHDYKGEKYRFLVMERFGFDVQKKLDAHKNKLTLKTAFIIAIQCVDVLEYIHSKGYVHGDLKAANLLTGYAKGKENLIHLVDFGISCKYLIDDTHKEYKPDPKKAHNGTIEFLSRDAHEGAFSRRGDLEVLLFNLLSWTGGRLPWNDVLGDCNKVKDLKNKCMSNNSLLLKGCYGNEDVPPGVVEFIKFVKALSFTSKPDYVKLKNILNNGLKKCGYKNDGIFEFDDVNIVMKKKPLTKKNSAKLKTKKVTSPKKGKPLRMKNNSPDISFNSDDSCEISDDENSIGRVVPTPAMLSVMEGRKKKMEEAASKVRNSKSKVSRQYGDKNEPKSRLGRNRACKVRTSPRKFSNSLSPEV